MRIAATTAALIALAAGSLDAQVRPRPQGGPAAQNAPSGLCRVWYEGVSANRQPQPMNCREAERVAARDRSARVIYGPNTTRSSDPWWRPGGGGSQPRAIPRTFPFPDNFPLPGGGRYPSDRYPSDRDPYPGDRYPYPSDRYPGSSRGGYRYANVAYDNGYNDGLDKGREDARDRDSYDPNRHSRYRSADRGYEGRYGSKDEYRVIYRDGFEAGYDEAYRRNGGPRIGNGRYGDYRDGVYRNRRNDDDDD